MDLGPALRKARESAGFTLPELAARTRIPQKTLRAIEEHDFSQVPAGIFARSFIRTYAREVGVDPTEAIAEFRAMTEPVVEQPAAASEPVEEPTRSRSFDPELLNPRPSWGYAAMVAVLFVAVIVVNRYTTPAPGEKSQTQSAPVGAISTTAEVAQPVATSGTGIRIEMRAERPCWVRTVVDGQTAFARLMQPGETETVTGERDVVVRVGDPSALSYSINGQPGESLGAAQVPVTVRFGPDGRSSRVS
jgi:cytoskeletal protein RodZ